MKRKVFDDWNVYCQTASSDDPSDDVLSFQSRTEGRERAIEPSLAHQPSGVRAVAVAAGIKSPGVLDLTVVRLDRPASTAAVFTKNLCASYAVEHDRRVLADGQAQLLAVVSKNANVFTPRGAEDTASLARWMAAEFDVREDDVVLSCTGGIGIPLPMDRLKAAIGGLSKGLRPFALDDAARAILTTDRGPKVGSVKVGDVVVCAMAKGAGMIEPNMATMLVYLFTNASLGPARLQSILSGAVDRTFNAISVDSDTSTSDTVVLFSTGEVPLTADAEADFADAVRCLSLKLARDIVSQAEGATKLIECSVRLDTSVRDARIVAKKIINSPLLKAAVHGGDPNWGRIVMAIGKPDERMELAAVVPAGVTIDMMGQRVFDRSLPVAIDLESLSAAIRGSSRVSVDVQIGQGRHAARVWGCDLSAEYVAINAEYLT